MQVLISIVSLSQMRQNIRVKILPPMSRFSRRQQAIRGRPHYKDMPTTASEMAVGIGRSSRFMFQKRDRYSSFKLRSCSFRASRRLRLIDSPFFSTRAKNQIERFREKEKNIFFVPFYWMRQIVARQRLRGKYIDTAQPDWICRVAAQIRGRWYYLNMALSGSRM